MEQTALLSDELLEAIFSHLPFDDLSPRCALVCKRWHRVLSGDYFWRQYIGRNFDLTPVKERPENAPYFYVYTKGIYFSPPPVFLNCGVAIPPAFNIVEAALTNPKQLAQALFILTTIKSEIDKRQLCVEFPRGECPLYTGHPVLCLFPWEQDVLPSAHRVCIFALRLV